ncbi:TPA: winged helix-turn-helix domain-containing protein [Klebsiella aerogenes]|nr:winged helix-turn-helix domain-containing protein [Klebsiella aerogenes]
MKNMDDCDSITLTPVLNSLLSHMLHNQGVLITKEDFFDTVWDSYGRTGSANTLKQYISNIRKILDSHLGIPCIITVPGQGYILSPELVIQSQSNNSAVDFIDDKTDDCRNDLVAVEVKERLKKIKNTFISKKFVIVNCSLILIIVTLSVKVLRFHIQGNNLIQLSEISKIGSCPVYGEHANLINLDEKKTRTADINFLLNSYNISCQKDESFYFFNSPVHEGNDIGRYSMLSVCHDKGSCISYRVNRYEN